MANIVVGIDGSEVSRRALDEALRIARERELDITVIHVVHTVATAMYPAGGIANLADALIADGENLVTAEIERFRSRAGGEIDVTITTRVAQGHPGTEIVRAAEESGAGPAELVVLGSRGYGAVKSLLLGSVTTFVIHHLHCPVLVIPAGD